MCVCTHTVQVLTEAKVGIISSGFGITGGCEFSDMVAVTQLRSSGRAAISPALGTIFSSLAGVWGAACKYGLNPTSLEMFLISTLT